MQCVDASSYAIYGNNKIWGISLDGNKWSISLDGNRWNGRHYYELPGFLMHLCEHCQSTMRESAIETGMVKTIWVKLGSHEYKGLAVEEGIMRRLLYTIIGQRLACGCI
jgi:hypothetical protein